MAVTGAVTEGECVTGGVPVALPLVLIEGVGTGVALSVPLELLERDGTADSVPLAEREA